MEKRKFAEPTDINVRDVFAAAALVGLIGYFEGHEGFAEAIEEGSIKNLCREAYILADYMLLTREGSRGVNLIEGLK